MVWPSSIIDSFEATAADADDDTALYGLAPYSGAYTTLLFYLFNPFVPGGAKFQIVPKLLYNDLPLNTSTASNTSECESEYESPATPLPLPLLIVTHARHPVFFIHVQSQPPVPSAQAEMRICYDALFDDAARRAVAGGRSVPVLHGASAVGERVAFYEGDVETRAVGETWTGDVLGEEGEGVLRGVVECVKAMCAEVEREG